MSKLVFIDESGTNKESGYSVLALVYIVIGDYPKFEQQFQELERSLRIRSFHWAKTSWPVREKFFSGLLKLEFEAKVAIIRNPSRPERDLERFLPHMLIEKQIHSIVLDGEKPGWYTRKLKKILRDRGVSTKKLRTADDESSAGIRAADAVAGIVRAYFDGKKREETVIWYERLRKKRIKFIFE